jgi:hypothetical protein
MPQYSKAQWDALGRLNIDPLSAEDMGNLAALLHVNQTRIYAAIDAVGPRIADNPEMTEGKPADGEAAEVAAPVAGSMSPKLSSIGIKAITT